MPRRGRRARRKVTAVTLWPVSLVLVAAGAASLLLPAFGVRSRRQLHPAEWARLTAGAIRLGRWSIAVGLFLTAAPTVFAALGVDAAADACHRLLGPMLPGGPTTAWASGVAFAALTVRTGAIRLDAGRELRRAHVEPWLGHHEMLGDTDVVVLPTDEVVAYAAPAVTQQVVVSDGLAGALTDDELSAVIRHEQAHLQNGHDRCLLLAAVVEGTLGWFPGVRRSTQELRLSLERWADEAAADRPGAREQVRRALLKTAETLATAVPAFTAASTLLARLDALGTPPPDPGWRQRAAAAGPVFGLAVVVIVSLVLDAPSTHHSFVGFLGICTS